MVFVVGIGDGIEEEFKAWKTADVFGRGSVLALDEARVGQSAENGQIILCVDEGSGLVVETDGEPFFVEEGEPLSH
ncbi:hypothetical protein [Jiella sp. M17.18]|uniref:hypothetical protein n=1 Tax=Jiella sp. M17.18 TaxID=3234247 RepID=UPI0034E0285B